MLLLAGEDMETPVKSQLRTVRANIRKSNADKLIVVFKDFILIPPSHLILHHLIGIIVIFESIGSLQRNDVFKIYGKRK